MGVGTVVLEYRNKWARQTIRKILRFFKSVGVSVLCGFRVGVANFFFNRYKFETHNIMVIYPKHFQKCGRDSFEWFKGVRLDRN